MYAFRGRRTVLISDGDFVDFLTERSASHFNPHDTIFMLKRIMANPGHTPVWEVLRCMMTSSSVAGCMAAPA